MFATFVCLTYRKAGFYWPVKSLKNQTRPPDEIIFALDHVSATDAFAGEKPPSGAKVVTIPFGHEYSAAMCTNWIMDKILDARSGMWLLVADHSSFSPRWIERHLAFQEHYDPALISGGKKLHDETSHEYLEFQGVDCPCRGTYWPDGLVWPPDWNILTDSSEAPRYTNGSSMSICTALLRRIGGWDERMEGCSGFEDALISHRAMAHSGRPLLLSRDPDIITQRLMCTHKKLTKPHKHSIDIYEDIIGDPEKLYAPAWRKPR